MIASYFDTAIRLCFETGPGLAPSAEVERREGSARLADFARESGMADDLLLQVLSHVPRPTHLSRRDVFFRLYFDRVFATLLGAASLTALKRRPAALWVALASFAYLAGSTLRGKDRYGALPGGRLMEGAGRVRELTGARTVVFGHTHSEIDSAGYVNTGSFAYPQKAGRPFAVIDRSGSVELRRFA
jgi:hypothetical protein